MANDNSEADVIAKDQSQNPGCSYSTSTSKTCRSINGQSECTRLHRIYRNCAGRAPVEIFSREEREEGGEISRGNASSRAFESFSSFGPESHGSFHGGHNWGDRFSHEHGNFGAFEEFGMSDPFSLMKEMMKPFQEIFEDSNHFGSMPGHGSVPFGREAPAPGPRSDRSNDDQENYESNWDGPSQIFPAPHRFPRGQYPENPQVAEGEEGKKKGFFSRMLGRRKLQSESQPSSPKDLLRSYDGPVDEV